MKTLTEKIRAALPNSRQDELAERELDVQVPVNARANRRAKDRARETRKRKGQRLFAEQQRRQAYADQTLHAQIEVLATMDPTEPMYRNVYNALAAKHGESFVQAMEQAPEVFA